MSKLIFLDIDGVLNSIQSFIYYNRFDDSKGSYEFCPIAVSNLKVILKNISDAKIVISSTWRKGESRWNRLLSNFQKHNIPTDIIIGKTPVLSSIRGDEIQAWLTENGETESDFVIIDDDSDMGHLTDHLVQTVNAHGLMYKDAMRVIKKLNPKHEDGLYLI